MTVTIENTGAVSIVRITGRGRASALPALERACAAESQAGARGLLIDVSGVTGWNKSGLAALVDLAARWPVGVTSRGPALGICGLDAPARADLDAAGLTRMLPLQDSVGAALGAAPFRGMRLVGMGAVVLCGSGQGALADVTPPALLDVLGRPVLGRLFDHLSGYGLGQAVLASAPGASEAVRRACGTGMGAGLARMSGLSAFHSTVAAERPAAALTALQAATGAIDTDTVVVTAPCVTDMDLAALVDHHRAAGAEATLAMASGPDGVLRPSGVAILTPAAIEALSLREQMDARLAVPLPGDLGEALTRAGLRCATWATSARAIAPDTPVAYMQLLTALLQDRMPGQAPVGERLTGGLWMAPGADMGRRTRIDGPAWVGPAAVVETGASLSGPAVVGAGARVAPQSMVRNGMLWAGAEMQPGAVVDGMIAAADWAISHQVADSPVALPLEHITGAATRPVAASTGEGNAAPAAVAPSAVPSLAEVPVARSA